MGDIITMKDIGQKIIKFGTHFLEWIIKSLIQ
jgi:hypothetical protein